MGGMQKDPLLVVKDLSKKFEANAAVKRVSLELHPGSVTALIGPNGSGKTTLIKCLVGLHYADTGTILIGDTDLSGNPVGAKRQLGYIPDNPEGFDFLTGREFLALTANLRKTKYPQAPINHLLKEFHLDHLLDQRIGNYSRGNRQKLSYVAALLGQPKILIIDEPIIGLDPDSIEVFGASLKEFARLGGAVLFSTHILEFGKRFASHLLVMYKGRIQLDSKVTPKTSLAKQYQRLTKE